MADVEFFFDPVCPWAWITSRWTLEVATRRGLQVDWRFICLRMVNEAKDYDHDFPPRYVHVHGAGRSMLRIAAAARDAGGNEAVGRLYTELGVRLHDQGRSRAEIQEGDDDAWDAIVHAETELALSRSGPDVGTPVLTFDPGTADEASFFGPVLGRIPRGDDATELWDDVVRLARRPYVFELKRTLRGRPAFG